MFDSPEWKAYADRALSDLLPLMRDSEITLSLVPTGETDVKFALELGFSIMLDKPIIAVVVPGARVPAHLVRVADSIVEGDLADPKFGARLSAEIKRVQGRLAADDIGNAEPA